jgi:hypothetical protein
MGIILKLLRTSCCNRLTLSHAFFQFSANGRINFYFLPPSLHSTRLKVKLSINVLEYGKASRILRTTSTLSDTNVSASVFQAPLDILSL